MACEFSIKKFDQLSTVDLYYILQARAQIFVIEAKKIHQDIDDIDLDSLHVVAHKSGELIGYCRIIPPALDSDKPEPKKPKLRAPFVLDKALMLPDHRGYGLGHIMLNKAIEHCRNSTPKRFLKVPIPPNLEETYTQLGFVAMSEPYSKNGGKVIDMVLNPHKKTKVEKESEGLDGTQVFIVLMILLGLLTIAAVLYLMS